MCPQVADPGEPLPTLVTSEGFLTSVNPLVLLQVPSLGEVLPAGVAAERFLPRVDPLMGLQVGQAGEGLAAGSADVAFLAPISSHSAGNRDFITASQKTGSLLCSDGCLNAS